MSLQAGIFPQLTETEEQLSCSVPSSLWSSNPGNAAVNEAVASPDDVLGLPAWASWPLLCPGSLAGLVWKRCPNYACMGQREGGPSQQQGGGGRGTAMLMGTRREKRRGWGQKGTCDASPGSYSGKWLRGSEVAGNEDRQKHALRRTNVLCFAKSLA